jgi:hypothetical protein
MLVTQDPSETLTVHRGKAVLVPVSGSIKRLLSPASHYPNR